MLWTEVKIMLTLFQMEAPIRLHLTGDRIKKRYLNPSEFFLYAKWIRWRRFKRYLRQQRLCQVKFVIWKIDSVSMTSDLSKSELQIKDLKWVNEWKNWCYMSWFWNLCWIAPRWYKYLHFLHGTTQFTFKNLIRMTWQIKECTYARRVIFLSLCFFVYGFVESLQPLIPILLELRFLWNSLKRHLYYRH